MLHRLVLHLFWDLIPELSIGVLLLYISQRCNVVSPLATLHSLKLIDLIFSCCSTKDEESRLQERRIGNPPRTTRKEKQQL